jgi:hypothetical protein
MPRGMRQSSEARGQFPKISSDISLQLRSFYRVCYVPQNVGDKGYRKLAVSVRPTNHGTHRYLVRTRSGFSTASF